MFFILLFSVFTLLKFIQNSTYFYYLKLIYFFYEIQVMM